tara:strand:+ start:378 stop:830 length:453 start_codon:yes stop_codon:yes gene_type:complete
MKKIITVLFAILFLNSCGYTPIYSSKNFNFKLKNISSFKNDQLHSKVRKGLQNFSNINSQKLMSLTVNVKKTINTLVKDSKGDPSRYEMIINIDLETEYGEIQNLSQSFQERFNYNVNKNKFELSQYEKEIENLLINKNIDRITIYLSKL